MQPTRLSKPILAFPWHLGSKGGPPRGRAGRRLAIRSFSERTWRGLAAWRRLVRRGVAAARVHGHSGTACDASAPTSKQIRHLRKMPKMKLSGLFLQIGARPTDRYPVCPLRPRRILSDRRCHRRSPLAVKDDERASSQISGPKSDFLATNRCDDTADRILFGQNLPPKLGGEPVRPRRFAVNLGHLLSPRR